MKRTLIVAVLLVVAVAVAGCGGSTTPGTPSDGGSTGEYTHQIVEVSPQKLDDMIQTDADLVIVDVSGKWADGHLVGAHDVPLDTLQTTINSTFSLSAGKHYVVYSHDEESSKKAAQMFLDSSFNVVYRLTGGYDAWVAYGGYVEK